MCIYYYNSYTESFRGANWHLDQRSSYPQLLRVPNIRHLYQESIGTPNGCQSKETRGVKKKLGPYRVYHLAPYKNPLTPTEGAQWE